MAGHEGYITVGLYDDGRPGELFITMAKEGSTIGGLMDCFGTAVSMSLQYGVPLEVYVSKFSHTRFEPMGHTKNPDIRIAKSLVDYMFRWLGITFLAGYRDAAAGVHVEEASATGDSETASGPAAKKAGGPSAGPGLAKKAAEPVAAESANGTSGTAAKSVNATGTAAKAPVRAGVKAAPVSAALLGASWCGDEDRSERRRLW